MSPSRPLSLALLLAMPAALSCRPAPRPPAEAEASAGAPLGAADLAAIGAADSAFEAATNAGDAEGVVEVYASDASLLPPNVPGMKGTDAIRGFWGGFLAAYDVRMELQTDQTDGRGDLAYVVGRYRFTGTPKTKGPPEIKDEGKFVEVIRRQADGSWKYVVDIYNSDLPVK